MRAAHIRHGGEVYIVGGFADEELHRQSKAPIESSLRSFTPLTEAEAAAIFPNRVEVSPPWHGKTLTVHALVLISGAVALMMLSPDRALAQGADAQQQVSDRSTVTIRPTTEAPTIDGRLDDPVWQTAARVTEFFQRPGRVVEGAPATEETEISITYDGQRLYFGIHAHYTDPSIVRANRVDRDQIQNEDKITIYIDPFMDQQRAYAFSVNAYGVQADFLTSQTAPFGDNAWNALFDTAGSLVEDGWTAEMSVPFKSLRYPSRPQGEPHRWGIQFERDIESKNEAVVWSPMSSDVIGGFIRQLGVLEGLTDLSTSRNLEFLPTATAIHVGNLDRATGTFGTEGVQEAGLNLKYGITSDLTFDFTYNPDFSQIESDLPQIEVNQRFPIFFPELRPFFLEGREIYEVPAPVTVVHTRTIVDPRYGAKLSGKIGNTSLGLLFADDEAPGQVDDPGDPAFDRAAQVVLARVRYDYSAGSHIGGLFTDREFLDSFSRLAALDGRWQIGRNYRLDLKAMTTRRKDVNGVKKTGELAEVAWRKEGRNFNYDVSSEIVDPDFGTDVGFVRRTDLRRTQGNVLYRWWPESWIINWSPTFAYERNSDHTGVLQDQVFQTGIQAVFDRRVNVSATVNRDLERFTGIDFWKTRYSFRGNVSTSRRVSFGVDVNAGDQIRFVANPFLGSEAVTTLTMTLRPFTRLRSDLRLNTSRFSDRRSDTEAFDVKIFRAVTTYQLTNRLVVRNISQYNSFDKKLDANILFTYRVNSGTVFFAGYDDHYRQGNQIDEMLFPTSAWRRTNRAVFTKLQYLFRY